MNFKVELDGRTISFIIMAIIITRLMIANFPLMEPYLEQCAYVHVTKDMKKISVEEMEGSLNKHREAKLYYIGRGRCGDCREVIKNVLIIEDSLSTENVTMEYVELENTITDDERNVLDSMDIKEIPTILFVNGKEKKVYDYYDMISDNYKERFARFIGGE